VSTDDCVVYDDLTEKVWNFRSGTWRGRETGRTDISYTTLCQWTKLALYTSDFQRMYTQYSPFSS